MTIKDIAKKSGYAVGTVSRVLNNHPNVSAVARQKILQVVDECGFVINSNAKQLKQHQSKNIAILVKGTSNILLDSILEIIQKSIAETQYTSSVYVLDEYDNEAECALKIYYERRPVGIIFLGGSPEKHREDFVKINVPCVLITNQAGKINNDNLSSVSVDDECAAFAICEHLFQNGHRKIGIIGGDISSSEISERRYRGFLNAAEKYKIDFSFEKSYQTTKYSFEGGANAIEALLKKNSGITAVFAMSDVVAVGAIRRLADMGCRVPGDISVVGFDGLPLASYVCPRITTIKQSKHTLAEIGLTSLLRCIENKSKSVHNLVPFELIRGESVLNIN